MLKDDELQYEWITVMDVSCATDFEKEVCAEIFRLVYRLPYYCKGGPVYWEPSDEYVLRFVTPVRDWLAGDEYSLVEEIFDELQTMVRAVDPTARATMMHASTNPLVSLSFEDLADIGKGFYPKPLDPPF